MKVENRVFFKDEQEALELGYRPCGHCVPEKYKLWKAKKTSAGRPAKRPVTYARELIGEVRGQCLGRRRAIGSNPQLNNALTSRPLYTGILQIPVKRQTHSVPVR
jgi:hypothetical protein